MFSVVFSLDAFLEITPLPHSPAPAQHMLFWFSKGNGKRYSMGKNYASMAWAIILKIGHGDAFTGSSTYSKYFLIIDKFKFIPQKFQMLSLFIIS